MRLRRESPVPVDVDRASWADQDDDIWTTANILRVARQNAGYSVADVATVLRFRVGQIEAMEQGRFDELPGGVYAIGFVRSYAEFLDLDVDEIVRRFKREADGLNRKTELVFPTPVPEGRMPSGAVLMIAMILAVVGYGGWYYASLDDSSADRAEDVVPPRFVELAEDVAAEREGAATGAGSAAGFGAAAAQAADGPIGLNGAESVVVSGTEPLGSESPGDTGLDGAPATTLSASIDGDGSLGTEATANGDVPEVRNALARVTTAALDAAGVEGDAPPVAPDLPDRDAGLAYGLDRDNSRVLIRAVADSWVQVRNAAGAIVATHYLRPGDSYVVPNEDGLSMITGNAGGLEISVDGDAVPSLGGSGVVLRNVHLDAQRLLDGTATSGG